MRSQSHLQLQSDPYASPKHTQQGYNIWTCDITAIKDPAGCLFHDKTFKASLWTDLILCHP